MSSPDWQKIAKELGTSAKERFAIWMIQHGFATGHVDSMDDLLHEMSWQIAERQARAEKKDAEIERLKALLRECVDNVYYSEVACPPSWLQEAREASK